MRTMCLQIVDDHRSLEQRTQMLGERGQIRTMVRGCEKQHIADQTDERRFARLLRHRCGVDDLFD